MIHLGNAFCILSAFLLGPVLGGVAAGLGSLFFGLLNPIFIASSPFTLIFKFTMAFVCGQLASRKKGATHSATRNTLAATAGLATYITLHLGKHFITNMLLDMTFEANLILTAKGLGVSTINAIIAVCIAVPLFSVIRQVMDHHKNYINRL